MIHKETELGKTVSLILPTVIIFIILSSGKSEKVYVVHVILFPTVV